MIDKLLSACMSVDLPTLVLVFLLAMIVWVLWTVQRDTANGIDLRDMLRDDKGKVSAMRLGTLIAIPFSSWFLIYYTKNPKDIDVSVLGIYIGAWVLGYVGQKYTDSQGARTEAYGQNAGSYLGYNPRPTYARPPAPPAPPPPPGRVFDDSGQDDPALVERNYSHER